MCDAAAAVDVSNRSHENWTTGEIKALGLIAHLGARAAARLLDRSVHAVKAQARRSDISLARPERIKGQRPDEQDPRLRLGAERLSELAALLGQPVPEICPECGKAPIDGADGRCTVCRLGALTLAHEKALVEVKAQRANDKARQEKRRERERAARERREALEESRRTLAASRGERSAYLLRLLRWEIAPGMASARHRMQIRGHDPDDPSMPPRAPVSLAGHAIAGTYGRFEVDDNGVLIPGAERR